MSIIYLIITGAAVVFGYVNARHFVRNKLRYVDAVQKISAPLIAGALAALVAWPLAALLHIGAFGTAAIFGISVGLGTAQGARDIRNSNAGLIEP